MEKIIEKILISKSTFPFMPVDPNEPRYYHFGILTDKEIKQWAKEIADDIKREYQITIDNEPECNRRLTKI